MAHLRSAVDLVRIVLRLTADAVAWLASGLESRRRLATENLFLRKQLALFVERQVKPRRADDATRIILVVASRCIAWRHLLTVVKPDTLIGGIVTGSASSGAGSLGAWDAREFYARCNS